MSLRAIAKKVLSSQLTIVAIVVCKRIRSSRVKQSLLGPLHMSPVDRAGPVSKISPHL